jgi:predicted DNA-binding protein
MKGELPVAASRIPHVLNDRMIAFAQETGDSPSKIVRDALSAYLGVNSPESAQSVEKRVAALERKLMKLAQMM